MTERASRAQAGSADSPHWSRLAFGIFLLSWVSVSLEVVLTRVLATILWYSVVYLVISMAVMGLGLGSLLAARPGRVSAANRPYWAIGLAASIAATGVLIYLYPFPRFWIGYLIIAAAPFVVVGALLSSLFRENQGSGLLYFADLSAAGIGSLAVVPLLDRLGGVGSLTAIALVALALVLYLAWQAKAWRVTYLALGSMVVMALAAALAPKYPIPAAWAGIIPQKTLYGAFADQGNRLVHSHWDSFSRTDVIASTGEESLAVFTDGGAGSLMYRFDGDLRKVAFLRNDAGFLPYRWGPHDQVLVIGPGGGKDILVGLLGGARQITAVELSPGVVEAGNRYRDYNGDLFQRKDVRLVQGDGRAYLERNRRQFDLIYLPLVVSQTADGTGSLSENYLFTKESLQTYLARLRPGGKLVVKVHQANEAFRFFVLATSALEAQGESPAQAARHILIINGASEHGMTNGVMFPTIVVQREPLTPAQLSAVEEAAHVLNQELLFVPGKANDGIPGALVAGQVTLDQIKRASPALRLDPPSDDTPFFWVGQRGLPGPVLELLVLAGLACLGVVLAVRRTAGAGEQGAVDRPGLGWPYFAALGVAYMLIEVGLIHRGRLFLGHPAKSIAAVLFGLLVGGGLGSLLSEVAKRKAKPGRLRLILLAVGVVAAAYGLGLERVYAAFAQVTEGLRSWIVMASVLPLGILMGAPFPLGLSSLWRGPDPGLQVPRMMAVNGVFSVLGSALALSLALTAGYTWTFLLGAVAYGALALALPRSGPERG